MLTSDWNYYFRMRMNLSLELFGNRLKIVNSEIYNWVRKQRSNSDPALWDYRVLNKASS